MRREPRRPARDTYSLCWQAGGLTASAVVQSVNLSRSGILVRAAQELPPGSVVYIQAAAGDLAGHSVVRRCTPRGDRFDIALEFGDDLKSPQPASPGDAFDYYEFLQISPNASAETIQRIHRILAGRFHPDNPETGDPEKFLRLQAAYEVLSDPQRRAAYDARARRPETGALPIFELREFVNGLEGEVNRRLGVLALLYTRRRTSPQDPGISLFDLEKRMAMPREYLDFTVWYLKSKHYITFADNCELALTAEGVDYVEANCPNTPILQKLLESGPQCATSAPVSSDPAGPLDVRLLAVAHEASSGSGDGECFRLPASPPPAETPRRSRYNRSEEHT